MKNIGFVVCFVLLFVLAAGAANAAYYVKNATSCPLSYQSQDCVNPEKVCGYLSGIVYCHDTTDPSFNPPVSYNSSYQTQVDSGIGAGYVLDCYRSSTSCLFWYCSWNSTCQSTLHYTTNCTSATSAPCTSTCVSSYHDCNNNTADGCENHDGDVCTVGELSGSYSNCNCVVPTETFETNTLAQYSSTGPLLWGKQYGTGWLLNLTNASNATFGIDASGCINFTDNTTQCTAGAGAGYWNLSGSNLFPADLSWNVGIGTIAPSVKLVVNGSAVIGDAGTSSATGQYAVAMGSGTNASGNRSTAMGLFTTASGVQSTAMGGFTLASGGSATAMGESTIAGGVASTAIGAAATASGDVSFAAGQYITANKTRTIVLGTGVSNAIRLVNNIENSLMIGFNSTLPTLFVNGSAVGMGTVTPSQKLDVNGSINISGASGKLHTPEICLSGDCQTEWPSGAATILNLTAGTYNGNITNGSLAEPPYLVGYQAANSICSKEFSGAHLCTTDDILNIIATQDITFFSGLGTSWIAEGPPGYTANSNDCLGWTSPSSSNLGPFWEYSASGGGMGWLTNCAQTKKLACCR